MRTKEELKLLQNLPLEIKIAKTKQRIREWINYFGEDGVYVSFSGGKDSTVLLDLVRQDYPNVEAVFVNTGLEYPEIQSFVKSFDNVTILRPEMRFDEVIKKYGYPIISKEISGVVGNARNYLSRQNSADMRERERERYHYHYERLCGTGKYSTQLNSTTPVRVARIMGTLTKDNKIVENIPNEDRSKYCCTKYKPLLYTDFNISDRCCYAMKKSPIKKYGRKTGKVPILATMTEESNLRKQGWLRTGCNSFEGNKMSKPMSFWTEQDVLHYIKNNNLPICSVYGDVVCDDEYEQISLLEENQAKLKTTGCHRTGCIFCAYGSHIHNDQRFVMLKQTHPKQYDYCINGGEFLDGIWQPSKDGLGMGYVFDKLNELYGENFIQYK